MIMNELNNDIVAYLSIGVILLTSVVGIAFSLGRKRIKAK